MFMAVPKVTTPWQLPEAVLSPVFSAVWRAAMLGWETRSTFATLFYLQWPHWVLPHHLVSQFAGSVLFDIDVLTPVCQAYSQGPTPEGDSYKLLFMFISPDAYFLNKINGHWNFEQTTLVG